MDWIIRLAGQIANEGDSSSGTANDGTFLAGLTAGIIFMLIGVAAKYLFDYRIAKRQAETEKRRVESENKKNELEGEIASRRLLLEERNTMYSAIGATQANFVRACSELYDRVSNFCDNQDYTSPWMRPKDSPTQDRYYLTEFVRRLFHFIAWGRITQDAINSLPVEVVKERPELQRTYTFVNLANSLLTFTWLFKGISGYPDASEGPHLFTGTLGALSDLGVQVWDDNGHRLPRSEFDKAYVDPDTPLIRLRDVLTKVYVEEGTSDRHSLLLAAVVVARLAAIRAVLAAYLSKDHSWALALSDEISILEQLERDLSDAESITKEDYELPTLVRRNLKELTQRYKCEWLDLP